MFAKSPRTQTVGIPNFCLPIRSQYRRAFSGHVKWSMVKTVLRDWIDYLLFFLRISEVGTTFRISSCSWRLLRVILYRETLQGSECAGAQKGKTTTALSIHCPFCEKKTTLAPKKEQKINSKKKHCQPKRNFYDWQSSSIILYCIHSSGESLQYSVH